MEQTKKCIESIIDDLEIELSGLSPAGSRTRYLIKQGYVDGIVKAIEIVRKYGEMYES